MDPSFVNFSSFQSSLGLGLGLADRFYRSVSPLHTLFRPELDDEDHEGSITTSSSSRPRGPLVQFARYEASRLIFFHAHTKELKYFALSHVWGKIDWLKVDCVDHDILASSEKARFINDQLPELVGDVAFWMDTLTVDQRNQVEVVATVQSIPDIFRDAEKTIAIREGDGIYPCCVTAVDGYRDYRELFPRLMGHVSSDHWDHQYDESYLRRLWTLQECLLSHTIEFVVNTTSYQSMLS